MGVTGVGGRWIYGVDGGWMPAKAGGLSSSIYRKNRQGLPGTENTGSHTKTVPSPECSSSSGLGHFSALIRFQDRPLRSKGGQERPKSGQERPKSGPRAAKSGQERPKSGERAAKSGPRATQERRKSGQERPKTAKSRKNVKPR